MHQVLDVDILNDADTQRRVSVPSLIMLSCGLLGAFIWSFAGYTPDGWRWWVALIVIYVVSLPLHELIHALFFKLFGRPGLKIKFGFSSGMLYAGCPGERFSRAQFVITLLAPFVVLSVCYVALGLIWDDPLFAWALFWLHASGCTGDFYFIIMILRHPEGDICEDTDHGFALWARDDGDGPGQMLSDNEADRALPDDGVDQELSDGEADQATVPKREPQP